MSRVYTNIPMYPIIANSNIAASKYFKYLPLPKSENNIHISDNRSYIYNYIYIYIYIYIILISLLVMDS